MTKQKVMVGCRVQPEIKSEIEKLASDSHQTAAEIIEEAILKYLGQPSGDGVPGRIDAI